MRVFGLDLDDFLFSVRELHLKRNPNPNLYTVTNTMSTVDISKKNRSLLSYSINSTEKMVD